MAQQQHKKNMKSWLNLLFSFVVLINTVSSQSNIIKTLPGYNGTLPFKLETGYISVGENDEIQLFYYFIESEGDPERDPLLFWLTGGPGCSGFSAFVYENIGPLDFDLEAFDGSLPSFVINPYSWTKIANIIFIDSPVGTGFSYANTIEGYNTSDIKSAKDNYLFLRKWLLNHRKFIKHRLYIGGSSYGGKIVPMVALEIAKGNEAGFQPRMLLQGYIVGNSPVDLDEDYNERIPYAHRMALISDEYFQLAKNSCRGEYVNPDQNNFQCHYALRLVKECINLVNAWHILEPNCNYISSKRNDFWLAQPFIQEDPVGLIFRSKQEGRWCHYFNYVSSYVWANDESVQKALHIRKGTITEWKRCNNSLSYQMDVKSVLKDHQLLSQKGFHALVYSSDHDMVIPYMSNLKWIRNLNLTIDEKWRPWIVDDEVAGYIEKYKNNHAYLTFTTVKGAGHTASEYKPKECFTMIKRWLSLSPL